MPHALATVRKFFPGVTHVRDAKEGVTIEVTGHDARASKRKKHSECALAVACKRSKALDGVIVSVSTAYLIKGGTAIRYQLPEHTSREIVSFDRGAGFEPGEYKLMAPERKLGEKQPTTPSGKGHGGKDRKPHAHTSGIRTVLGSKEIS